MIRLCPKPSIRAYRIPLSPQRGPLCHVASITTSAEPPSTEPKPKTPETRTTGRRRRPLTESQEAFLDSALRVNQTGELAAVLIYSAQTPPIVRAHPHLRPLMKHMYDQEAGHFKYFNEILAKHRIRPTAMYPAWQVAATALGWTTAIMGREAAMACTEAVETEIGEHYNAQVRELLAWVKDMEDRGEEVGEELNELVKNIRRIRDEELEHLDHAASYVEAAVQLFGSVRDSSCVFASLSTRFIAIFNPHLSEWHPYGRSTIGNSIPVPVAIRTRPIPQDSRSATAPVALAVRFAASLADYRDLHRDGHFVALQQAIFIPHLDLCCAAVHMAAAKMADIMLPLDYKMYHRIPEDEEARKPYEMDLVQLGYNSSLVKRFLGGYAPAAKQLLNIRKPELGNTRKGKHQHLQIYDAKVQSKHKNWVLLDPFSCVLDAIAKEDLPLVVKLAFYRPSNPCYLEYNTRSMAIRVRNVGTALAGRCVEYTLNGPTLAMLELPSGSDPTTVEPA